MKKIQKIRNLIVLLILVSYTAFGQFNTEHVVNLTTSFSDSPPSISFTWEPIPFDSSIYVFRKTMSDTSWGEPLAILPFNATDFTDNAVEMGVEYEYAIREDGDQEGTWAGIIPIVTYVSAGIKLPEIEYRGKVILLVDSSFIDSLAFELARFETDLLGDGWEVLRKDISRSTSVKYVKSVVRDFYYSDTVNVNSLILFGHLPVPYSGCYSIDAHAEHIGAQEADLYYGCMKEERWTDSYVHCTNGAWSRNHNVIGDGKFDRDELPDDDKLVLQIGRIDLCDLPAFSESESELLRTYLNKDYAYRHKIIDPKLQGLPVDRIEIIPSQQPPSLTLEILRSFTALFNESNVKPSEGFFPRSAREDSYMWASVETPGGFTGVETASTYNFTYYKAKTVFTGLTGSYNWDWDSRDNVLRASLASKGWILTNYFPSSPYIPIHRMGMGRTIGHCQQAGLNEQYFYHTLYPGKWACVSLLGDPTLRMHIVCPVNSLQSAITTGNTIMLAWKPATDSILGYLVYKLDTVLNEYQKITSDPVTDTWYEDSSPLPGKNYYMVKSYALTKSASGSYYNLSQGVFDTLNYTEQTPVPVTGIELYPDPENTLPLLVYDPFSVKAHILPENATNKLLKWSVLNATANGKLDVSGNILSDHGGILTVIAEALDGSGVTDSLEILIDSIPDPAGPVSGEIEICRDNRTRTYTLPETRGATGYIWTLPTSETDTTILNEVYYIINDDALSGTILVWPVNPFGEGEENSLDISIYDIPDAPAISLSGNILHSEVAEGNQWYRNDTLIEGAMGQDYTLTEPGTYCARVTLNNCTSANSNKIIYDPTGIEQNENTPSISIYPNPATNQLFIEFAQPVNPKTILELMDITGKVVYAANPGNNTSMHTIDLSALAEGVYFIKISNREFTLTERVVKY